MRLSFRSAGSTVLCPKLTTQLSTVVLTVHFDRLNVFAYPLWSQRLTCHVFVYFRICNASRNINDMLPCLCITKAQDFSGRRSVQYSISVKCCTCPVPSWPFNYGHAHNIRSQDQFLRIKCDLVTVIHQKHEHLICWAMIGANEYGLHSSDADSFKSFTWYRCMSSSTTYSTHLLPFHLTCLHPSQLRPKQQCLNRNTIFSALTPIPIIFQSKYNDIDDVLEQCFRERFDFLFAVFSRIYICLRTHMNRLRGSNQICKEITPPHVNRFNHHGWYEASRSIPWTQSGCTDLDTKHTDASLTLLVPQRIWTLISGFRVIRPNEDLNICREVAFRPDLTIFVSIPYGRIIEHLLGSSYGKIHLLKIINPPLTISYRIRDQ